MLRIYPSLKLFGAVETISGGHAHGANTVPIGSALSGELCMTWEICFPGGHVTLLLPIPSIAVPNATAISILRWTIWPCPQAIIHIERYQWQCGLWWKMVCHTGRRRGTYGVIIVYLFHGLQFKTGLKQRGKKAEVAVKTKYVDEALCDFSGYIAADELYDGPFCVLFIVDNHKFKRLYYEVLEDNPTNEDIRRFFRRFKRMLDARDLTLKGITTDGSALYPEPIASIFGEIKHQLCQFHVIKEITSAILKAVTQVRRKLKRKKTKCPRGRPSGKIAKQVAQNNKRAQNRIAELFEYRFLFVKHTLTPKEKKILQHITRGLGQLRNLRAIMDEVYGLFDRRCRTDTALEKLARLRRQLKHFSTLNHMLKKLSSPKLEKALTFLDDSLLPATSNAVERTNRRHRKMQKSIYRVRVC